jgi:hypothetical protein
VCTLRRADSLWAVAAARERRASVSPSQSRAPRARGAGGAGTLDLGRWLVALALGVGRAGVAGGLERRQQALVVFEAEEAAEPLQLGPRLVEEQGVVGHRPAGRGQPLEVVQHGAGGRRPLAGDDLGQRPAGQLAPAGHQ